MLKLYLVELHSRSTCNFKYCLQVSPNQMDIYNVLNIT